MEQRRGRMESLVIKKFIESENSHYIKLSYLNIIIKYILFSQDSFNND